MFLLNVQVKFSILLIARHFNFFFGNFPGETPSKFKILNEKQKTAYDCDHDQQ